MRNRAWLVSCMCFPELPAPSCMGHAASGYEVLLMLLIIISKPGSNKARQQRLHPSRLSVVLTFGGCEIWWMFTAKDHLSSHLHQSGSHWGLTPLCSHVELMRTQGSGSSYNVKSLDLINLRLYVKYIEKLNAEYFFKKRESCQKKLSNYTFFFFVERDSLLGRGYDLYYHLSPQIITALRISQPDSRLHFPPACCSGSKWCHLLAPHTHEDKLSDSLEVQGVPRALSPRDPSAQNSPLLITPALIKRGTPKSVLMWHQSGHSVSTFSRGSRPVSIKSLKPGQWWRFHFYEFILRIYQRQCENVLKMEAT